MIRLLWLILLAYLLSPFLIELARAQEVPQGPAIDLPLSFDEQQNIKFVCATAVRSPALIHPDQTMDIAEFCAKLRARMAEHAKKPPQQASVPLPKPKPENQ